MKTNLWTKENIAKFCFSHAVEGGAWLETKPFMTTDGLKSEKQWFSCESLSSMFGDGFFTHNVRRHGWMTGCWIDASFNY